MPQTRFSLALLLVVLLSVAVIARNSESAGSVTYYLHRTDLAGVPPLGKKMDITAPSGAETTMSMGASNIYYWYTDPPLISGTISTGTWTLRVYVVWSGKGRGTFNLTLVSQGGVIKATIVSSATGPEVNNPTGWYQITAQSSSSITVAENDRVRLSLMFSKATTLYYDGNTGNEATEQSRLEFTGSAPPPIPESPFGVLALVLIAFTVYILYSKRTLIKKSVQVIQ